MSVYTLYGNGIQDDTLAIQELLDSKSGAVYLPCPKNKYIISKPLIIHSNQSLVLDRFTLIQLMPGSNCLMLQNAPDGKGNENISVTGGIWDLNNTQQAGDPMEVNGEVFHEAVKNSDHRHYLDLYAGVIMRFQYVKNLYVHNLTMRNPITFCIQATGLYQFTINEITFDFTTCNPKWVHMDGVHLDGGNHFGRISNLKGTCYDDLVALNADDFIHGEMAHITVDGIYSEDCHSAVRLLSAGSRISNIHITNVHGTYYQYTIGLTKFFHDIHKNGQFNMISLSNIYASKATRHSHYCKDDQQIYPVIYIEKNVHIGYISVDNFHSCEWTTSASRIGVEKSASVDNLSITNSSYENHMSDSSPFIKNNGVLKKVYLSNVDVAVEEEVINEGIIDTIIKI